MDEDEITLSARHSVFVNMFAGRLFNDLLPILEEAERELTARVMQTDWRNERDAALLGDIRNLQQLAWAEYNGTLNEQLRAFSDSETDFSGRFLDSVTDGVEIALPAPEAVFSAVTSEPFTSGQNDSFNTLEPFIENWTDGQVRQVTGIVSGGVVQGVTRREMAARIDAAFNTTRNTSRTMVRTALNHISSTARDQVYRENDDVVIGYRIVATLDRRTSPICRPLDGLEFRYGSPPLRRPPFHPGCRTTTSPLLREEFRIFDEGAQRASQQGPVDSDTTYFSFLRNQPAAFQDAAIGPTRGRLLRDGGLTAEQFRRLSIDDMFQPTTLEEMMALDRRFGFGAFERARLTDG